MKNLLEVKTLSPTIITAENEIYRESQQGVTKLSPLDIIAENEIYRESQSCLSWT